MKLYWATEQDMNTNAKKSLRFMARLWSDAKCDYELTAALLLLLAVAS